MKVIGVTGGIGMGKSAAGELLSRRGIPVVDTDLLARQVVEPGEPALERVRAEFGSGVMNADGSLDRTELGKRVFSDPIARKKLEAILHPAIRARWRSQVETWTREGHEVVAVVIPLLFETGAQLEFNAIISVASSATTQRRRLLDRGWDEVEIQRRLNAQWSIEQKMELSNYVIWSEGSLDRHAEQLDRVLEIVKQSQTPNL